MRTVILTITAASAIASLPSCSSGSGSSTTPVLPPAPPVSLAQRFPIDGNVDFTVFSGTQQETVDLVDNFGAGVATKSTTIRWGVLNDDQDMYIAVEWNDDTYNNGFEFVVGPTDFDGIKLIVDDNANGIIDASDDQKTVIAASVSSHYIDQHFDGVEQSDQIGDGLARLAYDATTGMYTAEFLLPLTADGAGQDGNLLDSTPYNFLLYDHIELSALTGNTATAYPSSTDSSGWPALPLTAAVVHTRPQLPTNLSGLIIFISEHDVDENGDLYSFDPSTGVVNRLTNLPNLFKDGVSLSHDRTKIAFFGGPSKADYLGYEIYTVNVDGSNLQQVTTNTILDGHPAWSPDDTRLVFASFRDVEGESLITVTTDGTEIADLTPLGFHDNDPEYLADGRVLFKTDRFSPIPEVQIAVMNEDGSNVVQVTTQTGVSDHDPVGKDGFTVFERFPKATDFSTDIESGFVGWDLVEASLAGSETVLLADGWINWLPLYDPSGQYIAYQKSTGAYTDVRLLTRQGEELGRLIPDITRIRYIDWK